MSGGIISGSAIYGVQTFKDNPAATIIVPTVLQIASDMIDSITHLTCIYDRYWYNRPDMMTFPIAFFYVKKIQEIMETDTSEKRVMLYEPQRNVELTPLRNSAGSSAVGGTQNVADPLRPGVMQVIVDNAVKKPKRYQMELIVPYMPISSQFGRSMNENVQIIQSFAEMFGADTTILENIMATGSSLLKVGNEIAALATKFPQANEANFINKNSLEAMWDGQRILTMKMWSGYDYKYVMIIGLTFEKMPLEDDVFRATLNVKELPILSVTPVQNAGSPSKPSRNWAATAVQYTQGALLALPMAVTGVKEAAGEDSSITIPGV